MNSTSPSDETAAGAPMRPPTRRQALIDILLALALTLAAGLVTGLLALMVSSRLGIPLLPMLVLQGVVILGGLHGLLRWRGQRWRDVGLARISPRDVARALLALGLVFLVNAGLTSLLGSLDPALAEAHQDRLAGVGGLLATGLSGLGIAGLMLFVGLYEELLARGFLLSRCRTLLGGTWAPVILSSVLFGLGHGYQGWFGVLQTALVGLVFARLTLYWGTLWPAILAHAALNSLSLILLRELAGTG